MYCFQELLSTDEIVPMKTIDGASFGLSKVKLTGHVFCNFSDFTPGQLPPSP